MKKETRRRSQKEKADAYDKMVEYLRFYHGYFFSLEQSSFVDLSNDFMLGFTRGQKKALDDLVDKFVELDLM